MIQNPISKAIKQVYSEIKKLKFQGAIFIPSLITFIILEIVLILFVILWPYGIIPMVENMISNLMKTTRNTMKGLSAIEKTPFVVALGLYFLVWLPFEFLCLPFIIIGGIIGPIFSP